MSFEVGTRHDDQDPLGQLTRRRAAARHRVLCTLLIGFSCVAAVAQVTAPARQSLAITNVTVIDVTSGRTLANQTVVVEGGRIASVANTGTVHARPAAT